MMKKKMPIGIEFFDKFKKDDYYYVDKTLFIKELLDNKTGVNLFTRPRRFGKTLTLNMLKFFFEDEYDLRGNKVDNAYLFEDTLIEKCSREGDVDYLTHMGKYPVISLTLKSGKQAEFSSCMRALISAISDEFRRHRYILTDDILMEEEVEEYKAFMNKKKDYDDYKEGLRFLCQCLKAWSGNDVIILIDEYDVPLEGAYHYGFYDKMVDFIRGLFECTLKTNQYLNFAVITGCLRISKESIFTGLNNLDINSVISQNYGEYFGFTDEEVKMICEDYDLTDKYPEMKDWYNGYLFGSANVYNPWSIIKYVKDHMANRNCFPEAYWANTSSNSIVRDLIDRADADIKNEIENLIAGGSITIPVHEDVTYDEVYNDKNNLWNFMFFTGYFKKIDEHYENRNRYVTLKIPNWEIDYIFREKVRRWFDEGLKEKDRTALYNSVITGDTETFTRELRSLLLTTISFNDYYENFYHGFLAGVLTGMQDYIVKSNREGGNGRSDIFIKPIDRTKVAYVLELKVAKSIADMEARAREAIEQIIDRSYEQELLDDGYTETKRYGVAFFKKNCLVVEGCLNRWKRT